jgi:glutathione S-transferase
LIGFHAFILTKNYMIKLYGPRAGSALRNHWLLAEINVPYEHVPLDMKAKEHKTEAFLALNPNGQVPVMVEDDFVLAESLAINDYLAEKHAPQLLGHNPRDCASIWQWSLWAAFTMQKYLGEIMGQKWSGAHDEKIIADAKQNLAKYLIILNDRLVGRDFLVGDQFSVADINVATVLTYGAVVDIAYSEYPEIVRYLDKMTHREAYIKARQQS